MQVLHSLRLDDDLLEEESSVESNKRSHGCARHVGPFKVFRQYANLPDNQVQPSARVGHSNVFVREQRTIAAYDSPRQLWADPEQRRRLQLAHEIVGDECCHTSSQDPDVRSAQLLEDDGDEGFAAQQPQPDRAQIAHGPPISSPDNPVLSTNVHAFTYILLPP